MLGMKVSQALVVIRSRWLRHCRGCAISSIREEGGSLRGVDIPGEGIRRLEFEPATPPFANLNDHCIVPGVSVALFQLYRGESCIRPWSVSRVEVAPVRKSSRRRYVDVGVPQKMNAPRTCITDCHKRIPPQLTLEVEIVYVYVRILQVPLHRADCVPDPALELWDGKTQGQCRAAINYDSRGRRRIGYRHDKILLIVGIEIGSVS